MIARMGSTLCTYKESTYPYRYDGIEWLKSLHTCAAEDNITSLVQIWGTTYLYIVTAFSPYAFWPWMWRKHVSLRHWQHSPFPHGTYGIPSSVVCLKFRTMLQVTSLMQAPVRCVIGSVHVHTIRLVPIWLTTDLQISQDLYIIIIIMNVSKV
jgi:hypothetical protein